MKQNKIIPCIFILLAGSLWGLMGLFVRTYNDRNLGSFYAVIIRSLITSIVLFIYILVTNKSLLIIKLKDLWCFIGTGILSVIFFNYCYFKAIVITSLSAAAVLLYTAPIFVMIMSRILFKEKITVKRLAAIVLTFAGCVLVTGLTTGSMLSIDGILVGLGAGFGYALYSIFSKFAIKKGYSELTITFYTFLIASIGSTPFINVNTLISSAFSDYKMILFAFAFGLISTVLPYLLYTAGLKGVENSTASIIASIEPVVATLVGIIIYHESLGLIEGSGIILVLAGIILAS